MKEDDDDEFWDDENYGVYDIFGVLQRDGLSHKGRVVDEDGWRTQIAYQENNALSHTTFDQIAQDPSRLTGLSVRHMQQAIERAVGAVRKTKKKGGAPGNPAAPRVSADVFANMWGHAVARFSDFLEGDELPLSMADSYDEDDFGFFVELDDSGFDNLNKPAKTAKTDFIHRTNFREWIIQLVEVAAFMKRGDLVTALLTDPGVPTDIADSVIAHGLSKSSDTHVAPLAGQLAAGLPIERLRVMWNAFSPEKKKGLATLNMLAGYLPEEKTAELFWPRFWVTLQDQAPLLAARLGKHQMEQLVAPSGGQRVAGEPGGSARKM